MPRSITDKLTSAERQALLHADPDSGLIRASGYDFRQTLSAQGYAEYRRNKQLYLTEHGWRLRARLQEEHKPFAVAGVPWRKMEEITDLYLLVGLNIDEISHRARVDGDGVRAVLRYRGVLVAAA